MCPFRHEPAALENETVCAFWSVSSFNYILCFILSIFPNNSLIGNLLIFLILMARRKVFVSKRFINFDNFLGGFRLEKSQF
jgi:hypothetical protein